MGYHCEFEVNDSSITVESLTNVDDEKIKMESTDVETLEILPRKFMKNIRWDKEGNCGKELGIMVKR